MSSQSAERLLMNEFKALSQDTWTDIEANSLYYGGYFKARMSFPKNYPYSPPDFKFIRPLYHPNIYPDGRLCISILHAPGDDEMSGELASERWSPVQRVETVLLSVLSLLDDPEVSSPANVDAGVMLRNAPELYKEKVTTDLNLSKQDIPAGYVMPTHEAAFRTKKVEADFDMSWEDSDVESFGGSESDMDEEVDSDFGEVDEDEDEDDNEEEDAKDETR